jgi:hypothetical protein
MNNSLLQTSFDRFRTALEKTGLKLLILGLLFLVLTSCATTDMEKPAAGVAPQEMKAEEGLTNAKASIEDLCKEVLERMAQRDIKGMHALALTEDEMRKHVWPYLELSRPGTNMTFERYWGDIQARSHGSFRDMYDHYGGKKFEFISYEFKKETWSLGSGKVHRDSLLTVRNEDGETGEVRVFGSVFELNGKFKFYSFALRR